MLNRNHWKVTSVYELMNSTAAFCLEQFLNFALVGIKTLFKMVSLRMPCCSDNFSCSNLELKDY